MYAVNLDDDGRVLSATSVMYAAEGATLVPFLPEGDIHQYRYERGAYIYDPRPEPEPVEVVAITTAELETLREKSAAYDILTEGVST